MIDNLNEPGMAVRDIYMRLALVDSTGTAMQLGSVRATTEITRSDLHRRCRLRGRVTEVYIPYTFDSSDHPRRILGVPGGRLQPCTTNRVTCGACDCGWRTAARPPRRSFAAIPQVGDESVRLLLEWWRRA